MRRNSFQSIVFSFEPVNSFFKLFNFSGHAFFLSLPPFSDLVHDYPLFLVNLFNPSTISFTGTPDLPRDLAGTTRLAQDHGRTTVETDALQKTLLDLLMDWNTLPAVANVPLVKAWQRLVERGLPVLVITAEGKLRDVFFDRIHRAACAGLTNPNLVRVRLQGTNHIFTTGGAIEACIDQAPVAQGINRAGVGFDLAAGNGALLGFG